MEGASIPIKMTSISAYLLLLLFIVVAVVLIKKMAGCLVKTIIVSILFTVLCAIGWYAKQQGLI